MVASPASRRAMLCGIASLPVMGSAAVGQAPSSLALACRDAIRQAAYMNTASQAEGWSDDRLDVENDRYDDLFRRAIDEPSLGLPDLRAKAQLALDDFRRQHFCFDDPVWNVQAEAELSDDERLIRVVLEEVIALCA